MDALDERRPLSNVPFDSAARFTTSREDCRADFGRWTGAAYYANKHVWESEVSIFVQGYWSDSVY